MVVHPPFYYRVELLNQDFLFRRFVFRDGGTHLCQKPLHILLRRLDQQLAFVGTNVLSQKVESLRNMRDARFLRRESETALPQECRHHRLDFVFQELSRVSGDQPVIGVPYEVDLGIDSFALHLFGMTEGILQSLLQTIKRKIS